MSRINIEVTPEFHQAIKMMAFEQGVSLQDFVVEKLVGVCKKQTKKPNARLLASINEALQNEKLIKAEKLKTYKTTEEVFSRY
jgi:hypothetical protein